MKTTVISLSAIINASDSFRIDADYFQEEILLKKISRYPLNKLEKISDWITQGPNPQFSKKGIPCLTGRNIADGDLNLSNVDIVNEEEYKNFIKFKLALNDILITLKGAGSTGKVALYDESKKAIFSRNLGLIRINNDEDITPEVIYTFLASAVGQKLIDRGVTGGTGQLTLPITYLRQIELPKFSKPFVDLITLSIKNRIKIKQKARKKYKDAEFKVLSDLGLSRWQPNHQLTYVKNFSDTNVTKRIDAEYFQPKYDALVKKIKNYPSGWKKLDDLVSIKKGVEVGSQEYLSEGIPFIRVSNLNPFELTEEKYISEDLYAELKNHQPKQGEVLLSKDATPGIAYYIRNKPENMISSSGILRLTLKNKIVNQEYLTLVLNSLLTQEQINRDVGGSVILHWRPDQVKETVVPILPKKKQEEIQKKISEAFTYREKSKQLLEVAKQTVELAIGKDEKTALKWLQNKISSIENSD